MKFRPIIVHESMEYEQCFTTKEITKAIRNKTFRRHYDGRAFMKTKRELLCEFWFKQPYYKVFSK